MPLRTRSRSSSSRAAPPPAPVRPQELTRAQAGMFDLFTRLQKPALAFARKQVGRDAADDIVQQSMLETIQECFADDEVSDNPVDGLFLRILRNRCVDWQRDEHRMVSAPAGQADSGEVDLAAWVEKRSAAVVAEGSMLSARVEYIIASMPPEMQRVMRAARDTGWENARVVADVTGMSYDIVGWHLKKGRERLRQQLVKDGYPVPAHLIRTGRPTGSGRGTTRGAGGTT